MAAVYPKVVRIIGLAVIELDKLQWQHLQSLPPKLIFAHKLDGGVMMNEFGSKCVQTERMDFQRVTRCVSRDGLVRGEIKASVVTYSSKSNILFICCFSY